MTSKKQKEKDRRRAKKLADQAWAAVSDEQNLDLAEKLIRRAVATQEDNPVIWHDLGQILRLRQKEADAEQSFRAAISLASNYAEPYAQLATLRLKQGLVDEAIALLEQAVKYAPVPQHYLEQLESFRAIAKHQNRPSDRDGPLSDVTNRATVKPKSSASRPLPSQAKRWQNALESMNWEKLGDRLTRQGCVLIPRFLDSALCEYLAALFQVDDLFAKTVVMDQPTFGDGVYRYFKDPVPELVDGLRYVVYPFVAEIANAWQAKLGEPNRYPTDWEAFRLVCKESGQVVPTPILLRYGPGGFNALHRDVRGAVYFPIQMAVILSRRADPSDPNSTGFSGGEFQLADVPQTNRSRHRLFAADQGDVLLFCTRERLIAIGGAYGLQPVKHGVTEITAGERVVLGLPFHEYR